MERGRGGFGVLHEPLPRDLFSPSSYAAGIKARKAVTPGGCVEAELGSPSSSSQAPS